jgi:hypothetical protein
MEYIRFKHPFTTLVAGPTGCGKTVFIRRILQHHLLLTTIEAPLSVMWSYGEWQDGYDIEIPGVSVEYIEGLPSREELVSKKPQIVVIDDLMSELGSDKKLTNLFTKGSHHMGISVFFVVQNLFHQGSQMRTISLNSHYIVVMKNPRDRSQITHLGRQVFPKDTEYFQEAFTKATEKPYGYLCIDLTLTTPEQYRLRSRLTPEESIKGDINPIVYVPTRTKGLRTKKHKLR